MELETRNELNTLHERVNALRDRVVNLEAQQPHIAAALARIERSVERVVGYLSKAVWVIIALFLAALFKVVTTGTLHLPGV